MKFDMLVTRDKDKLGYITLWSLVSKPVLNGDKIFEDRHSSLYDLSEFLWLCKLPRMRCEMSKEWFKELFGFIPRKGSKKRYTLDIELKERD